MIWFAKLRASQQQHEHEDELNKTINEDIDFKYSVSMCL